MKPARRAKRIALIAAITGAALALVYTAAGFVLVPWLIQREVPRYAETQFAGRARVADVSFNPYTLVLEARDFALEQQDGRPLASARQVVADFEWRSLARRGWMLAELRLAAPSIHIEISESGQLNLAALVKTPPERSTTDDAPRFALGRLVIADGRIDFADRREQYEQRLEQLSIELKDVSTLDTQDGRYTLAAQTPDGARLHWSGALTLQPLAATGVIALERGALPQLNPYLDQAFAGRIASGYADVEVPYRFSLAAGKPQLEVSKGKIKLLDVALARRGAEDPFARFGQIELDGIEIDLQGRRAAVEALRMRDFSVSVRRAADGAIDVAQLMPPKQATAAEKTWEGGVAAIEFSNGAAMLVDEASGLDLRVTELGARLKGLGFDGTAQLAFELTAAVAERGRLALNGTAAPDAGTLNARIESSGLPLGLLQPALASFVNLKLMSGEAALTGDIALGGDAGGLTYSGSAALTNVALDDAAGARLMAWKSLSAPTLRYSTSPMRLEIDEVRWSEPAGRLAIMADGTTNLARVFARKDASQSAGDNVKATEDAPAYAAGVRRLRIERGQLDFSDESLTPGFAARIEELTGTINGISTDRDTRSQIALEGRVEEHGYARVSGGLNVFEPSERTNLRVQFRNVDVTKVSPYTMKFAGYRVASGRMSLDLNYSVRDNLLQGDNKIVLEQFTLGERVESPNALDLPLELAVALLKDENGVIDVAIPISGNLSDPTFDFGAVIWKAIGNLVGNIIRAPFRALARLFGGTEEALGAIAFEPGSARLLPPEREKIARIAEALAKRPELKLEVPAAYDPEADARALKRGALRREIAKRAGFDVKDEDPPGPVSIEDQRTRDAVRALFEARFSAEALEQARSEAEAQAATRKEGKPAPGMTVFERLRKFARGEPQVADLTPFYRGLGRRLVESQPLPEGALEGLARQRASAIAAALREAGVDAGRIAQAEARAVVNADGKQVLADLALGTM